MVHSHSPGNLVHHRQPASLRPRGACKQVAENSQQIVDELNASGALPYTLVFKPILTRPEEVRALCLEANSGGGLRRPDPLDAHLFAFEDVDRRALHAREAVPASAHAIQSRPALGRDRHGFHESQPGRPRRPRGRVTSTPVCACGAKSSSAIGPTRRSRQRSAAWMRVARAWHDLAGRQVSPASATTCVRSP